MSNETLHKRPLRVAFFLCTLFCASLISASSLNAATYYVAPNGSDSNNGSSNAPFRTIQKAADEVGPGDTVIIRNGTYTGDSNSVADIGRSGTSGQWITFKAENEWGAILDGRNNATRHGLILESGLGYVRFEGLQIQGTEGGGFSASENTHDIVYYRNLLHDIGRNCTDTTGGQVGFRDKESSSRMVYDSNVLHTIGRLRPNQGCNNLSTNNYRNHDHGLYLRGSNVTIVNNVFYNIRSGWSIQSASGADNWVIANNTFAFPNPDREGHIVLWEDNNNIVIANNIFYEPQDAGVRVNPCSDKSNIVMRNNISTEEIMIDTGSDNFSCGAVTLSNNMPNTDPGLANPSQNNFELSSSSPAINKADSSTSPSLDQTGAPRTAGSGPDIGAFEFGSEGPSEDTNPPQISIQTPAPGATVSGEVVIVAEASDNVAVAGVQFQVNGSDLGPEDTTNTFSATWDTTGVADGLQVVSVVARDAAGNTSSTAVTVTVENQQEETPREPLLTISVTPSSIQQGQSTTVSWESHNTTECIATGDWGGNRNLSGQQVRQPSSDETYILTCTGPGGDITRAASVTVTPVNDPDPPTLTISTTPSSIQQGQSTTVSWFSQNTTGCTASGDWGGSRNTSGQQVRQPSSNETYTLTCTGPGGDITRSASVSVTPVAQQDPPTLTINTSPSSINEGEGTMVSWSSQNTTDCVASGDWAGSKDSSGQQAMQPSSDETYTLTCSGPGGDITRSASVSVASNGDEPSEPSLSLEASDTRIRRRESVVLTWSSEGVTECRAFGSWRGSKPVSGQTRVRPYRDSRYTLWCQGPNGSVSQTVRIDVRR